MAMLKIAVGCDPNAASAKAALMQYLGQKGFLLTDFGSDGKTGRDLSLLRVYSRVRLSAKDRSNCRL